MAEKMDEKIKRYSRRQFIDLSARGAASLIGYSLLHNRLTRAAGRLAGNSMVVVVKHDAASKIEYQGSRKIYGIDQEAAQAMMDAGIRRLTGIEEIGEAWKSLFPGITQNKTISIKLNCIARQNNIYGLASHPEVAYSIVNGLTRMQVEGQPFPEENIIIWDRSEFELVRSGFSINKGDTGVRCYGTRYEIMREGQDSGGYSTAVQYDVGGVKQYLSQILVDHTDFLINTCLFKDHVYSGVTLSLKNHYGSCWAPRHLHGGNCNPYIPALNVLPPIRDKQVLCICDAIYGIKSGGPMGAPQITPNTLIFSKDTVALDTIGKQMLQDSGTSSWTIAKAKHIDTAAEEPYSLGTNDPGQIDLITIENPGTGTDEKKNVKLYPDDFRIFHNYPNPFNAQTMLSYQLLKPARVKLDIYNIRGAFVRSLANEYQGSGYYRIRWDGMTSGGKLAPSGIYLALFQINNVRQTIRMQLIK